MGVLSKGTDFSNGDQVTDTNLDNLVDSATFTSSAVDDISTAVSGAGAIIVRDGGITTGKLADSTGASDGVTAAKIATGAVTTAKLAASAVTKAKIENVTDMKVLGNTSGSAAAPQEVAILDEDTMSSNSATSLATQQSIKAYVDSTGLIQRKRVTDGTVSNTTATMNFDNTAPLISEGTEILSTTFTPTSTSNEIIVDFNGILYNGTAAGGCMLALFEDSVCVGAYWWFQADNGGAVTRTSFSFTPSSTNEATYSLRFGVYTGQTGYINSGGAVPSGYTLGGNVKISMEIQEVRASQ